MMKFCVVAMSVLVLTGCAVNPRDIGRAPALSPVGSGLKATSYIQPLKMSAKPEHVGNSFWQDQSADLFRDGRARHVGDVVTVRIAINDKASLDNSSNRSRDSKGGIGGNLDYSLSAKSVALSGTGSLTGDLNSNTSSKGTGAIARSESIDLMVAAVVTGVLPNGNLIISGSQEVRVNFEVRVLNVAGVVRPRDIVSGNTVSYDKIAEARIAYGGRGRLTEIQQPALGHQILDILSPF